ncbi:GntR family transcriptional regulator [Microtetraspora sp. NBRC 13810]|uniref:GntR family transcriptional regulator n=1 Tax=Microtetraspora sp. NBRC 13810 TaxID=3030990 RepID=UPI002557BA01|nr:GntR family transcriptional regulator [Microtetraspora sp. NBRC 13810]
MADGHAVQGLSGIQIGRVAAPLREQVLDGLRKAILDFRLKPGQRLVERELIEQIGVSRTTIREVLRELAAEGLVTVIPQKGVVVYSPSPAEAEDLYAVRVQLETLAVRLFIERASADQVTRLTGTVDEMEAVMTAGGDMQAMLTAKDHFYEVLLEGAGPVVEQILGGVQARVRLLRATSLSQPDRPPRMLAEMRALVEAVAAREPDLAAELCAVHLNNASATGIAALSAQAAANGPQSAARRRYSSTSSRL